MIQLGKSQFTYAQGTQSGGLNGVNLTIQSGEFILLCGESGCGKTTLTRLINGLIPHYYEGELKGKVTLEHEPICGKPLYQLDERIGSVFQNPRSQFFNLDTTSEIVCGCENIGLPADQIQKRLEETIQDLSLAPLMTVIYSISPAGKSNVSPLLQQLPLSAISFSLTNQPERVRPAPHAGSVQDHEGIKPKRKNIIHYHA